MLAGAVVLLLAACGGGGSGTPTAQPPEVPVARHVIGGTLSGITSGTLVLQNNAGDELALSANGGFNFATSIEQGSRYEVTALKQPLWQFCSVNNDRGQAAADVTNVAVHCEAAQATVSTLAGSGTDGMADGEGPDAQFKLPRGVTVDAAGNVYVADSLNLRLRLVSPSGTVTTLAGGGLDDTLEQPFGLALDADGNVYLTELWGHKVKKIAPGPVVSTVAGSGSAGSVDGNGVNASFNQPAGIAIDAQGNLLVADSLGRKIRKITPAGEVSTFAGSRSGTPGTADGTGADARFMMPAGITIDAKGNLFVTDFNSHVIRKITPQGMVSTPYGKIDAHGSEDGHGNNASFNAPVGIAIDSSGSLYVADSGSHVIRRITPDGMVSTLAGTPTALGAQNGVGAAARFWDPYSVAVDASGNVYVADKNNHQIRKITPTRAVPVP